MKRFQDIKDIYLTCPCWEQALLCNVDYPERDLNP